jgi:integrase
MATSTHIVLRKKANKSGKFPLMVRITKNRKSSYISTGHYIDIKDWDIKKNKVKKSYPNSTRLNNLLIKKLSEINSKIIDLESKEDNITLVKIKNNIKKPFGESTFNSLSEKYINELIANDKYSRLNSDGPRIKNIIVFAGTNQLYFQDIDQDFLKRLMSYLKIERKNCERSIVNNLVIIRTLYNRAIREGHVDQKFYPFGRGKIKIKFPESNKVGLSIEEVIQIEILKGLTDCENHARNVWLFSFYNAGMRIGDILTVKWSDIIDDRIVYKMSKNSKTLSIKVNDKVKKILDQYENNKQGVNDFIFPELKRSNLKSQEDILKKKKTANKKFNKYLAQVAKKAEIDKKITMHIARHTFGNISGDKIPIQMLQKLYRHSNISTTINYQANFMHKEEDDAIDKVINF